MDRSIKKMNASVMKFRSPSAEEYIDFNTLVSHLIGFVKEDIQSRYMVFIGTDSAGDNYGRNAALVSVVGVWRKGSGGIFFITKSESQRFFSLDERMNAEAIASIMLAQEIRSKLRDFMGEEVLWNNRVEISVHLDVGDNGSTKKVKDAVVGMVRGFGLAVATKPDSFAAYVLADRYT